MQPQMLSQTRLTRLSLSLGGSWGSDGEVLGVGREGAFGFSLTGVSTCGTCVSIFFSTGIAGGVSLLTVSSDGATWVSVGADLEITATLVPGVTVSPSLAVNYQSYKTSIVSKKCDVKYNKHKNQQQKKIL